MNNNEVTAAVVDALEACNIEYMLVGAYSSNAYGVERATHDADFVVHMKHGELRALTNRLGADFLLDPQMRVEGITGSLRNVITYVPSKFDVEIFRLNLKDPHHQERFRRKCRQVLTDINRPAWIPSGEDVVIQKLRWQRPKDLDDVLSVIGVSGSKLDWKYIEYWANEHGTLELLREMLKRIPSAFRPGK
jgi:hypothetical protein